jgi:pimeloyl-ACP methyl ester carboxylesterase
MLATVNGIQLAYTDTGGDGPVFLLVHGFPLNRSMWDPQLEALRAVGRVIAPDLRGFGASELGPRGPLTMAQHADDLAALLDHLKVERVIFVGLSMGGYVEFAFWARHKDRVRALVLSSTRATADTEEGKAGRYKLADEAESVGSTAPFAKAMLPHFFAPGTAENDSVYVKMQAVISSNKAETAADAARGIAVRPDSRELARTIDVPTLILVGEHDAITPVASAREMSEHIADSALMVIPHIGHIANIEAPDAFNQALISFARSLPKE